nr:uncharacterized protein CTRU02_03621 [Colletotrichum truncatum]KAF6796643.1 hypothetical protein CTRU02_03621 [Colletotrichum truncatum]
MLMKVIEYNTIKSCHAGNRPKKEFERDLYAIRIRRILHETCLPNTPSRTIPRIYRPDRLPIEHHSYKPSIHVIEPY